MAKIEIEQFLHGLIPDGLDSSDVSCATLCISLCFSEIENSLKIWIERISQNNAKMVSMSSIVLKVLRQLWWDFKLVISGYIVSAPKIWISVIKVFRMNLVEWPLGRSGYFTASYRSQNFWVRRYFSFFVNCCICQKMILYLLTSTWKILIRYILLRFQYTLMSS